MTLWTPEGEHPVRPPAAEPEPELTPEEQEQLQQMQAEMAEVRQQVLSAPAAIVVANHAMGIYELAAIHLTAERPQLSEAVLAIDALSALVDGLQGRLGEAEPTLREALTHLKAAYLDLRDRTARGSDGGAEEPPPS